MRTFSAALGLAIGICVTAATAGETSIEKMPYPGAVALSQDLAGEWIYKSFPDFLPLYIFDNEPVGSSTCDEICAAVWPIISAVNNAKPVGSWSVVKRSDGRKQWAYKGKPVYMYFEDGPGDARGAGKKRDWFLDNSGVEYLISAGVTLPPAFRLSDRKQSDEPGITAELLKP